MVVLDTFAVHSLFCDRNYQGPRAQSREWGWGMQYCTPAIWEGVISQILALSRSPEGLPEEALTQVFQVRSMINAPLFRVHVLPENELTQVFRIALMFSINDCHRTS